MMSRTSTVLRTLQNVQVFLTTHADTLGSLNASATRTALDDLVGSLRTLASTQTTAASGGTAAIARQRVLRNTLLVKYLRPISAIAAAQAEEAPDFLTLKLPRSIRTTQQLLAAADSMGTVAAKYATTFIAGGMAPTFVADLQAAANQLEDGATLRDHTVNARIGATSGLKTATRKAHKVINALDALIEPALANNPALLTQWKATKRFTGRPTSISSATIDSSATVPAQEEPSAPPPAQPEATP